MNRKQRDRKKNKLAQVRREAFLKGRRYGQVEAIELILDKQMELNKAAEEIQNVFE